MIIKVGIVEDVSLTAEVMKDILEADQNICVLWIAKNGKEAIQKLEENADVHVLLMDINMPEMNGIEATQIIKKKWEKIKIVMSTVYEDEEKIFDAILAGASGYLVKNQSPDYLQKAIKEAIEGDAPMTKGIASKVLDFVRKGGPSKSSGSKSFGITAREKEILEELVKGLTYEQIAKNLCISLGTVRKHIEKLYRKLQVNNKVEAINKAQSNKLL